MCTDAAAAAGVTSIDLTTVYTPISKPTISARNVKSKLLKQPPPVPPTPLASHSNTPLQLQALKSSTSGDKDDSNFVVAPSKSYITQPTTATPKILKRSGQTAELKLKKPIKEIRNRTKDIERSSKLQAEVVGFIISYIRHCIIFLNFS